MNLFTKSKQTHRHRKQSCGYQRGKGKGGINLELGNNRYTLLYIKQVNNKDLLYSTVNYIQYLEKPIMEKNLKKKKKLYIYN